MANPQNLVSLTTRTQQERTEIARKGQKASTEVKRRKASIQSTGQITKAMKLVSTVKLQKAKASAENTKPYFDCMYETLSQVLSKMENVTHPYITPSETSKKGVICITSNKG